MLAHILVHHEDALRASLQAEYQIRLLRRGWGRTEPQRDLIELWDLVKHLPAGSALGRAQGGQAAISDDAAMIRALEYTVQQGIYMQTDRTGPKPKPLELPPAPGDAERAERLLEVKIAQHQRRAERRTAHAAQP